MAVNLVISKRVLRLVLWVALNVSLTTLLCKFLAQVLKHSECLLIVRDLSDWPELNSQAIFVSLTLGWQFSFERGSDTDHHLEIVRVVLCSCHC